MMRITSLRISHDEYQEHYNQERRFFGVKLKGHLLYGKKVSFCMAEGHLLQGKRLAPAR